VVHMAGLEVVCLADEWDKLEIWDGCW